MAVVPSDLTSTLIARRRAARAAHERRGAELVARARVAATAYRAAGTLDGAWLVGSLAWGGFGTRSDVDIVVRGAPASGFGALAATLSDALGAEVDLMRIEELPDAFRRRVLERGMRLDEP